MTDYLPCPCIKDDGTSCGGIGFPSVIENSYSCMMCSEEFSKGEIKKERKSNCSGCGSDNLLTFASQGDVVCQNCSIVVETIVSDEQEWNNYTPGVNKSRVGMPGKNPFTQLGSTIPMGKNKYDPLRRSMFMSNNNNSKEKAYGSVDKIFDSYELPSNVKLIATKYWSAILKSPGYETHRSSVRSGILFSMIFFAAKEANIHLTIDEIMSRTGLTERDMNRGETIFKQMIACTKYVHVVKDDQLDISESFERYMDFFEFTENDRTNSKVKFAYSKICRNVYFEFQDFFENRKSTTIIGGIMLYTFNNFRTFNKLSLNKITTQEIAKATKVSSATLNKALKVLVVNDISSADYDDLTRLKSCQKK